jgi:catechol 2,3-dioxygenase-like lactoylglutathione lyase family enzyme
VVIKVAIPVLHVSNAAEAREFYCGKLGFQLEFAHRGDEALSDPCYMGVSRDGAWLHLSSFPGDGVVGGVVNFVVDSVDDLHREFLAKGVAIALEPVDQTWGTREMYVKDGDGNCLRFQSQAGLETLRARQ